MDKDTSKKETRSGAWTIEELEYVDGLIDAFKEGWLDLPSGATMRNFLAESLNCAPKRISKRMESTGYNGRKTFVKQTKLNEEEVRKKQARLQELKERYERSAIELDKAKAEAEASKAALPQKKMPGKHKAKPKKAEGSEVAKPPPRAPVAASLPTAVIQTSRAETNSATQYSLLSSQSTGTNSRRPFTFANAPPSMAMSQPSAMSAALPDHVLAALRSVTAGQTSAAGFLPRAAAPGSAGQDLSPLFGNNRDISHDLLGALLASRTPNAELTSLLVSAPTPAAQFAAQRPPTIEEYLRQIQAPVQQPAIDPTFSRLASLLNGYAPANPPAQSSLAQQQVEQQYAEDAVRELLRRAIDLPSLLRQNQQQSQNSTMQDLLQRLVGQPRNNQQSRPEFDDQNQSNKRHKPN